MSSILTINIIVGVLWTIHQSQPITAAVNNFHLKPQRCTKNITNFSYNINDGLVITSRELVLVHQNCLALNLPYTTITIPDYVPGLNFTTFDEVANYLQRWQSLEKLPICWPYLQRALCSVLMPRYDEDLAAGKVSRIHRPSLEICLDLRRNCKFVEKHYSWPSIFNCSDANLYSRSCVNELRHTKVGDLLSKQNQCLDPLVSSNDNDSWFEDVQGCALSCKYPVSNPNDQANISSFIRIVSVFGLVSTFAAMVLFAVSETKQPSRIARVVKRCNICQFVFYMGWSLQVLYEGDIGCGPGGLPLYGIPLVANVCVLTFFLTYLSTLTNLFWCAYLAKLCYEKLNGGEKKQPKDAELSRSLNLFSFGVPFILFSLVASLGEIDGQGLFGICTVGQRSIVIKSIFIFAPKLLGNLIGGFYFFVTILNLTRVGIKFTPSLRRNFRRIAVMAILNTTDIVFSIGNYIYEYNGNPIWRKSIVEYVKCSLDPELDRDSEMFASNQCAIGAQPMVTLYFLEVMSNLSMGIVIASWACCKPNFRSLRKKIIQILETEKDLNTRLRNIARSAECNGKLAESCHDMIDMTSPNGNPPDLELGNQGEGSLETNSLVSCSLSQISVQPPRRNLRNNSNITRDVVAEGRMRQQNQGAQEMNRQLTLLSGGVVPDDLRPPNQDPQEINKLLSFLDGIQHMVVLQRLEQFHNSNWTPNLNQLTDQVAMHGSSQGKPAV